VSKVWRFCRGALTPTEIVQAGKRALTWVKVFTCGAMGGASYIKSLKAPLPQIEFVPTGRSVAGKRRARSSGRGQRAGIGADLWISRPIRAGQAHVITERGETICGRSSGTPVDESIVLLVEFFLFLSGLGPHQVVAHRVATRRGFSCGSPDKSCDALGSFCQVAARFTVFCARQENGGDISSWAENSIARCGRRPFDETAFRGTRNCSGSVERGETCR